MSYEHQFLRALLLTVSIETAGLILLSRSLFKDELADVPRNQILFCGVFCSFATLPYLWFLLPAFIPSFRLLVFIGESAVVLMEAVMYSAVLSLKFIRALVLSFLCNLISFSIGLILQ